MWKQILGLALLLTPQLSLLLGTQRIRGVGEAVGRMQQMVSEVAALATVPIHPGPAGQGPKVSVCSRWREARICQHVGGPSGRGAGALPRRRTKCTHTYIHVTNRGIFKPKYLSSVASLVIVCICQALQVLLLSLSSLTRSSC